VGVFTPFSRATEHRQTFVAGSQFSIVISLRTDLPPAHAFCVGCRYSAVLEEMHNDEHLAKFEDLLEAAVDLEKIPDEYLIAPTYDSGLEASPAFATALTALVSVPDSLLAEHHNSLYYQVLLSELQNHLLPYLALLGMSGNESVTELADPADAFCEGREN